MKVQTYNLTVYFYKQSKLTKKIHKNISKTALHFYEKWYDYHYKVLAIKTRPGELKCR